jgi:hypothetical protein
MQEKKLTLFNILKQACLTQDRTVYNPERVAMMVYIFFFHTSSLLENYLSEIDLPINIKYNLLFLFTSLSKSLLQVPIKFFKKNKIPTQNIRKF